MGSNPIPSMLVMDYANTLSTRNVRLFLVNLTKPKTITTATAQTPFATTPKINLDTDSELEKKVDQLTRGVPQYFESILMKMAQISGLQTISINNKR
jgi:hypothetical protein